jgi:hypothetical protein
MKSVQIYLSPAAGKRLIAKALISLEEVKTAIEEHTVVIVAGTTNAAFAEEALKLTGNPVEEFDRYRFFRGLTKPATRKHSGEFTGDVKKASEEFFGDVILEKGKWIKNKTIFDYSSKLTKDDLILKGANAVCLSTKEAAVLIGNPEAGTAGSIFHAVYGRRVPLIVPVGLEKRVEKPITKLMEICNDKEAKGPRLALLPGKVFTELDAVKALTGAEADILAAGGVSGYEGGCYLICRGEEEQLRKVAELKEEVTNEPAFYL